MAGNNGSKQMRYGVCRGTAEGSICMKVKRVCLFPDLVGLTSGVVDDHGRRHGMGPLFLSFSFIGLAK